jgi:hypothetical protein
MELHSRLFILLLNLLFPRSAVSEVLLPPDFWEITRTYIPRAEKSIGISIQKYLLRWGPSGDVESKGLAEGHTRWEALNPQKVSLRHPFHDGSTFSRQTRKLRPSSPLSIFALVSCYRARTSRLYNWPTRIASWGVWTGCSI